MNCQYRIILTEGENKGIEYYVRASEKQIENARNKIKETEERFCSAQIDNLNTEKEDSLLEIIVPDEQDANKFAEILGLPKPFIKIDRKYVLDSRGDLG